MLPNMIVIVEKQLHKKSNTSLRERVLKKNFRGDNGVLRINVGKAENTLCLCLCHHKQYTSGNIKF